jgi:hypothetical protein
VSGSDVLKECNAFILKGPRGPRRWTQYVSLKSQEPLTHQQSVIFQRTWILRNNDARTLNIIKKSMNTLWKVMQHSSMVLTLKVSVNNHNGNLQAVYFPQVSPPKPCTHISSSPYMPHAPTNSFLRLLINTLFHRYSDVLMGYHVASGCRNGDQFSGKHTFTVHVTTHFCGKCHWHTELHERDSLLIRYEMLLTSFCSLTFKQAFKMQNLLCWNKTANGVLCNAVHRLYQGICTFKMPYIFMAQV